VVYHLECARCDYDDELFEGVGMAAAVMVPLTCATCARVVAVQTTPRMSHMRLADEPEQLNLCPECDGAKLKPWGHGRQSRQADHARRAKDT